MKHFIVLHLLLFLQSLRSACSASRFTDQNVCRTPEGRPGVCTKVQECFHMMQFIINLEVANTDIKEFLKLYTCGYDENNDVKVCCPPTPIEAFAMYKRSLKEKVKLLPTDSCGVVLDKPKLIIGNGRNADLFQFPWMAILMYSGRNNFGSASTQNGICGGTLITKRYVLTAAHCINQKLVNVRLGEFNLATERDCNFIQICAKPSQNFKITTADVIVHRNYIKRTLAHDIALIRLKTEADTSTGSVTPICLPKGNTIDRKRKYIVAGWGMTETGWSSNILKEARLIINKNDVCIKAYSKYKSYMRHENHLCTHGVLKDENSCAGDSGGPLMLKVNDNGTLRMTQYGIVSFGITFCQYTSHHGFPSVFTNLLPYIDWILKNIEP